MGHATPILLVTGGLGAGKTTALNQLLKLPSIRDRKVCLIINEFGQMGVDGQLVTAGNRPVYELNKGSLFCICIKTEFITTLTEIADRIRPELLIVEATGMAEPRDVEDFIDEPSLADRFHIRTNICLIDASSFVQLAPMLRAVRQQAMWADALIVNKTDLVSAAELEQLTAVLDKTNPEAPILETTFGRITDGFLDRLKHTVRRGDQLSEPPDPVFSLSFSTDTQVDKERFGRVIADLGQNLLRLKGQADFGDGPEFVEVSGAGLRIGSDDTFKPRAGLGTAFVVIGWRLSREEFQKAIESIWS